MGIKRRAFLIGGVSIVGGGLFALRVLDGTMKSQAAALTAKAPDASFAGWLKIGSDDTITVYSPHIDFGQGSQTALAQMLADELDADWSLVRVEQAPADRAFANTSLVRGEAGAGAVPDILAGTADTAFSMIARHMSLQVTGGSTAIRDTGQWGMRVIGAAARQALIETAADRLKLPASELTTAKNQVIHLKSRKTLRYGELAADAAGRTLNPRPILKEPKDFTLMGQNIDRLDIPNKVNGSAVYGIDFSLPNMRIATIMAAPVRDGKLLSVDPAPAMAIKGVEAVIKLDDAVAVVAKGYWQAITGARALAPKFSDGGHSSVSTASIFEAQEKLRANGKPKNKTSTGDVANVFAGSNAKLLEADYKVPFLHQATMEPPAITAHFSNGALQIWGGVQDPLSARDVAAKAGNIDVSAVTLHPMIMGGGFGRRFPGYYQIIEQVVKLAMQLPYPVKLIWSREEDVTHGAYRPQCSAHLKAAVAADGKITAWANDYAQFDDSVDDVAIPYVFPATALRHHEYISNQVNAYWRSVNATQQGFYTESFMDELAHSAGVDPFEFRRMHLTAGSRHRLVLEAVAKRSGWGSPLEKGRGRGIALVESFKTIVAQVVEASMQDDGTAKVHRVFAVVDCGRVINPINAESQIQGAITMGLSAALGEQITLDKGAVVQSSFTDYPILKMAAAPVIDVHFIESGAALGGLGEPGLPPAAPALANALFAATGKRIRQLPVVKTV